VADLIANWSKQALINEDVKWNDEDMDVNVGGDIFADDDGETTMIDKVQKISDSVKLIDGNITKVEFRLIKNKYSGIITASETDMDNLDQLIKVRQDMVKKQDSRVAALDAQLKALLTLV
jgi:hypothetical protein